MPLLRPAWQLETEPCKILGARATGPGPDLFVPAQVALMASCNRVPVVDGHTESVFVHLERPATLAAVRDALHAYRCEAQALGLPSAPSAWCVCGAPTGRDREGHKHTHEQRYILMRAFRVS
jgi:aspartate-semialdehyde dehydrogenase